MGEIVDMALVRVGQSALGPALSPPIERCDLEPALRDVPDRFEIFLDTFRAALEQAQGPKGSAIRREARDAQHGSVARQNAAAVGAGGDGIVSRRDEFERQNGSGSL